MDTLGLGVRLDFDDNMSSQINPLIRDLERLRRAAQGTTQSMNGMNNAYNPYNGQRRRDIEDYRASMVSTDRALINISDRLIRATRSAHGLSTAVNRMQFAGNFNQMYSSMMRTQRMLGNMGYGMSKMQKDMGNMRAFNMMNYQMKDLQDRIKLTTQALKEMQNSPDSSKYREQMNLAQKSLLAYKTQLAQVGSLEKKLADTHGYGSTKSNGKTVLYEKAKSDSEALKNHLLGASMLDMAVASNLAYNSLDKTGKLMTGLGYTTMEARQKLTQMLGTLQMVGMGMTQFLTVPLAIATAGIGIFASKFEQAFGQFQSRTLTMSADLSPYQEAMTDVRSNTAGAKWEDMGGLFANMKNSGIDDIGRMKELSSGALNVKYASGGDISAVDAYSSAVKIATKLKVSDAEAFDLIAVGLKKYKGDLESAEGAILSNSASLKAWYPNWKNAYDILKEGNDSGAIQRLTMGIKRFGDVLEIIWTSGLGNFVGGLGDLIHKVSDLTVEFFRAHPLIAKFSGYVVAGALSLGMLLGPIAVGTAFLLRFRNVIAGTGLAVAGFAKGGLALLSPQAKMAMTTMHAFTVAIARFPQTLLMGAIPALFLFIRGLPMLALNILKLNPLFSGLTIGMLAYSKNWLGFGDAIDSVVGRIKSAYGQAQGLLSKGLGGEAFSLDGVGNMTQIFAKMQATGMIAKKTLTSIFGGTDLEFTGGEQNLMQQLGIEGFVNGIAKGGKIVKDFWDGFKDGVAQTYSAVKTFGTWMADTFKPVIEFIGEAILNVVNSVSKLFGGTGFSGLSDIQDSASALNKDMFNLGKMAGVVLASFLGFKALKSVFGLFKNPFAGFISSAKKATSAVKTMSGAVRGAGGSVRSIVTGGGANAGARGINRLGRDFSNRVRGQVTADRNNLGVTRAQYNAMNPNQQANHNRRLSNARAQMRGYDLSNATGRAGVNSLRDNMVANNRTIAGQNDINSRVRNGQFHTTDAQGRNVSRTIHTAQQGRMSRALFGQRFDTFDEQGRRRTLARQGGLLRGRGADGQISDRADLRTRASQQLVRGMNATRATTNRAMGAVGSRVSSATAGIRSAGNSALNSRAMKPVTVPVRYVMGRLQTAGIIRQGQQGGQRSGGLFKRAFQAASRGIRVTASVAGGAANAGAKAGRGVVKGFGVVGKGIGGVFKLGFKLIPFLGWALMAWDIISAVFTNWDKIKAGALKAWNWISTNGLTTLQNAWATIQEYAGIAWDWILNNGKDAFISISTKAIELLGIAFTWILTKAGEAFLWIVTDGLVLFGKLALEIFKLLGKVFTDLIPWALGKFGELVGAVWDVGKKIGASIFEAIKSGFGDIGKWLGGKVSGAVDSVKGWFGGGKEQDPTLHARGGVFSAPHLGIVGEAGPEAIIPLSGNQRNRAHGILQQVAGTLGMTVQKPSSEPVVKASSLPVRKSNPMGANSGGGAEDNSIIIQNVNVVAKEGVPVNATGGRQLANSLAKELQKIMKQERLRSNGNKLTLEELILNM